MQGVVQLPPSSPGSFPFDDFDELKVIQVLVGCLKGSIPFLTKDQDPSSRVVADCMPFAITCLAPSRLQSVKSNSQFVGVAELRINGRSIPTRRLRVDPDWISHRTDWVIFQSKSVRRCVRDASSSSTVVLMQVDTMLNRWHFGQFLQSFFFRHGVVRAVARDSHCVPQAGVGESR